MADESPLLDATAVADPQRSPVLDARGVTKTYRTGWWPRRRVKPVLRGTDVGMCAALGVAAGLALLMGPLATPWPTIAVLAVMAIGACAGVIASINARPSHNTHRRVSTPPGVGYDRDRDDPVEWS